MKNRVGLVVLVLLCVALGITLVTTRKQANDQQQLAYQSLSDYSNTVFNVRDQLERQKQVNAEYEKDIETQRKAYRELTNSYTRVATDLAEVSSTLSKTEDTLKTTQQEVAKRDARISELENQNQALDKQALELTSAITNLTVRIAETQRKLEASEGDKAFLENELKRLMSEKAELERQFNDLAVLRAQVAKLKEELNIARRIEWIRRGLFTAAEQKGAQGLMQGAHATQVKAAAKPAYDLNVEVSADGSVKVIPPASSTNVPAQK